MKILRVYSNNVVLASDEGGAEVVAIGKGLGFGAHVGDTIAETAVEKLFVLKDKQVQNRLGEIIGDRDVWKFDDVGELFIYRQEQGLSDGDVRATYVKGYDTGQWVEAGSAHYVVAPDVATPMGTHVLALAEEDSVGAYTVSESARERTYEELLADP